MITHQIDRLTEDERQLLRSPVCGWRLPRPRGRWAISRRPETEQMLEALARKGSHFGNVHGSGVAGRDLFGSYAFHHILYQNVLYQRAHAGAAAQIHRRGGEAAGWVGKRTADIAPTLRGISSKVAIFQAHALSQPGCGEFRRNDLVIKKPPTI
jgi:hypothetical protein